MNMRFAVSLVLLSVALTAAAGGQVYKWKDSKGHVHYGDQPVPGAQKIEVAPVNSEAAPAGKGAETDADRAKRTAECARKREQLATYKNAARIVEKNSLGVEREFSDAERQQLIAQTEKQLAEQCADQVPAAP